MFGIGEHHRPDFVVSAPAVALAAAAARTSRIRLTSAVTVLSSDDPVRVFEEFATVDLISGGRAEIMAGPRLVHRVVPAVRLQPRRLRRAVRREARAAARAARRRTRDLVRQAPRGDRRSRRLPASGAGSAAGLGRGRRLAGVRDPRREARPADGARDHRRTARAVRPVRRAPPARSRRAGHDAAAAQHQLARLRRRDIAAGRGGVLPALRRDDEPRSAASAAGRESRGRTSTPSGRGAARSSSAAPTRSSRRSSSSTSCSVTSASWRRRASARCRTRRCSARSSCSARWSRRPCGPRSRGGRRDGRADPARLEAAHLRAVRRDARRPRPARTRGRAGATSATSSSARTRSRRCPPSARASFAGLPLYPTTRRCG